MLVRRRPALLAILAAVTLVASVVAIAVAGTRVLHTSSPVAAPRAPSGAPAAATPAPSATPQDAASTTPVDAGSPTPSGSPSATPEVVERGPVPHPPPRPAPTPGPEAVRAAKRAAHAARNAQIAAWIQQGLLPDAPSYGGAFDVMANNLWRDGAPDVMSFGDSMVQQGLEPAVLEQLVRRHTGSTIRAFNGASSRARWGVSLMLARWAERHRVLPKVALLGITTLSPKDDLFYSGIVEDTAFSAVAEGCNRDWEPKQARRCEKQRSDLSYRFRGYPGLATAEQGLPMPKAVPIRFHGWLRRDGFLFHRSMTVAQVERDSLLRLARRVPGWPYVQDEPRRQFRELVALLRQHGVTVLAFSLPYSPPHQRNLEATYPGYDWRRQEAAAELAASASVPLFQVPSYGPWWGDRDSRDAIHLARKGAASFTRQLWGMPGFARSLSTGIARSVRY